MSSRKRYEGAYECLNEQEKVNTADSAFICLIILFDQSKWSEWSGWSVWLGCLGRVVMEAELQKRADQSVLFFLAGANFWEKHVKNRRKHAKTGENTQKQALFWC